MKLLRLFISLSDMSSYVTAQTINVNGGLYFNVFNFAGGTEAFAAIEEASKIGLRTIIIDKDQNCPGKIIRSIILCSAYDTENILKNLREIYDENNPYSGVIHRCFSFGCKDL